MVGVESAPGQVGFGLGLHAPGRVAVVKFETVFEVFVEFAPDLVEFVLAQALFELE